MLEITIPPREVFLEEEGMFEQLKGGFLQLEYSLISISKWESKWHKPFLDESKEKTPEEMIDYIRCMTVNRGVDPDLYNRLPLWVFEKVAAYIKDPMTASTITSKLGTSGSAEKKETVTSELIYYWMIAAGVPVEFEKWHLSRLLTLIKIVEVKNKDPKKNKLDARSAAEERARINKMNRKKYKPKK